MLKSNLIRLLTLGLVVLILGFPAAPVQAASPVSFQADAETKSGTPGSTVTFNLTFSSTETEKKPHTINAINSANWTVNISPSLIEVGAGSMTTVQLEVVIPPNAQANESTNITLKADGDSIDSPILKVSVVTAATPTPPAPPSSARPVIVIESTFMDTDTIKPGDSFVLFLGLKNNGSMDAHNLIFSFQSEDFLPEETGGVVSVGLVEAGKTREITQRLRVNNSLWGKTAGSLPVKLTYSNPAGEPFTESFSLSLSVRGWSGGSSSTATPTPTATAVRAQLVVSSYQTDTDPLQPGSIFNINMELHNLGSGAAHGVTMVLGGGSIGASNDGTPAPGGVSGGSADLSVFAPLGSSNLQFLGDILPGAIITTSQKLIVNVSANPGAYALKLSFVYNDDKGNRTVDDQIVTLLVYQIPQVEVNFYRDPGAISAMQPNTLPIQVVNLGRKSAVMGNMTVTAQNADLMNNVSLVGTLDAGGYFPLDVMFIPQSSGPTQVTVTINYTDDFNQPRKIEKTLQVAVQEGAPGGMEGPGASQMGPNGAGDPAGGKPGIDPGLGLDGQPGAGQMEIPAVAETFWQKALRFFKGLIGLDSAPAQPQPLQPGPGEVLPGQPQPVPIQPGGKG